MEAGKVNQPEDQNIVKDQLTQVSLGDTIYYTKTTKKFNKRKKWEKPDEKKLSSVIPGTVRDIFVNAGDEVEINDKLLILEAMKMNNVIYSNIAGKIKRINVNTGDRIPGNSILMEFE